MDEHYHEENVLDKNTCLEKRCLLKDYQRETSDHGSNYLRKYAIKEMNALADNFPF